MIGGSLHVKEGLDKTLKWGTLGDAPSVATKPEIVKTMRDAGCSYISFGFESASDKVLNQDIGKGQLQIHEVKTIDAVKQSGLTPIATFMIGNPHEDINDLLETMFFWIRHNIEVDPFICTPYVGSPLFFTYKDFVLEQYEPRLQLIKNNELDIPKETVEKWKLRALDKFMTECGDATQYTATVSQYFSVSELFSIKQFMYKKDIRRILQLSHDMYDRTQKEYWLHDKKWESYCKICEAKKELLLEVNN